jgi:hypothetical protein
VLRPGAVLYGEYSSVYTKLEEASRWVVVVKKVVIVVFGEKS